MPRKVIFKNRFLPYALLAPEIAVVLLFFLWPAAQAIGYAFFRVDAFGLSRQFVGLENFALILGETSYLHALVITAVFSFSVTLLTMIVGLFLAVQADRIIRGAFLYKSLLVWPYAVAPAVAGVLWLFLFHPTTGIVAFVLQKLGYEWNHLLNGTEALILVILAAAWKRSSYTFLFFLAGLQSIPRSLVEAAAVDGARPFRRFWDIVFPLLSPVTFFLVIVNLVYSFVDTFGIIHMVTKGGPAGATSILVYKIYHEGFINMDLGGSSAQSIILMGVIVFLTFIQFRYVEKKVHY